MHVFAIVAALFMPFTLAAVQNAPEHPAIWSATYVAAYQPQFGNSGAVPYSGIMKLNFNNGVVSGTYDSQSVRPDPLSGRIVNVTGTISGTHVSLRFATSSFTLSNGTIKGHGTIQGTANYQGHLYNFLAKIKSMP